MKWGLRFESFDFHAWMPPNWMLFGSDATVLLQSRTAGSPRGVKDPDFRYRAWGLKSPELKSIEEP